MTWQLRSFLDADYAQLPALFALLEPAVPVADVIERSLRMRTLGWQCLGCFEGERLIAMAGYIERIHLYAGSVLYVENVAVLPDRRGEGLGQVLMDTLAELARARGCSSLTLDAYASNGPARAFYERLGYEPRGIHYVYDL